MEDSGRRGSYHSDDVIPLSARCHRVKAGAQRRVPPPVWGPLTLQKGSAVPDSGILCVEASGGLEQVHARVPSAGEFVSCLIF